MGTSHERPDAEEILQALEKNTPIKQICQDFNVQAGVVGQYLKRYFTIKRIRNDNPGPNQLSFLSRLKPRTEE